MDLESPDVEKEFPGLYSCEGSESSKSRKNKDESDYSEGDYDKASKKEILIGRRKDKKDKSKDRGYAALEGESSPEEELDTKSPTKTKKSKTFKFTSSKSRDKREKSRDKEKIDKDGKDDDSLKEKEKSLEKEKDKDGKKKEKDKKEKKDKLKEREKDKDRKDKKDKSKQAEETLGQCSPVFGVSVILATERSRCHDGVEMPLVVRDCIDFLQEHGLTNDQIYRVEPLKAKLCHFKKLYDNRERDPETDILDIPTACGLLKLFLKELPESILTDLLTRFEEAAAHPNVTKQQEDILSLLNQLPKCNRIMLSWILLHFDAVIQNEKLNKLNAQTLAMLLSPPLQMSHRLLVTLLCHSPTLFAHIKLVKYIPPLSSSSPKLPDTPEDIQQELCKQESLLNQLHSEMNSGFVSKKREEQLWEVQRIITQLKRKLKLFEKKNGRSVDDTDSIEQSELKSKASASAISRSNDVQVKTVAQSAQTVAECHSPVAESNLKVTSVNHGCSETTDQVSTSPAVLGKKDDEGLYVDAATGFLMTPKTHPEYKSLIRLQLENQELLRWINSLQARISAERTEIMHLKQLQEQQIASKKIRSQSKENISSTFPDDYERIVEQFIRENSLLEHKKQMLAKEIFEENKQCIALQIELMMQKY